MIVLGIDPGSRRCGYGVVAGSGGKLVRLASGVLEPGRLPAPERLGHLFEGLSRLLRATRVDAVAVETAFCGRSPRSALALGQARGVVLAAVSTARLPLHEYAPAEVKRAFAGNGQAEKAQMVRMARTLFGVEARLADEADALAVAVCCLASLRGASRAGARGPQATPDPAPRLQSARRARDAAALLRPSVRRFVARVTP